MNFKDAFARSVKDVQSAFKKYDRNVTNLSNQVH